MSLLAIALLVSSAAALAVAVVVRRRRSARRAAALVPLVAPRAPGVSHLAARVSELSDMGLHLHAASRAAEKRRLGVLLGLR